MFGTLARLAAGSRRLVEALSERMCAVAGWIFIFAAVFIFSDVVTRTAFGFSSQATVEVTGFLLAVGMSWGFAFALKERAHVRIDVLLNKLPLRLRSSLHLLSFSLFLVFASFCAWRTIQVSLDSWEFGARSLSRLRNSPGLSPSLMGVWPPGVHDFWSRSCSLRALSCFLAARRELSTSCLASARSRKRPWRRSRRWAARLGRRRGDPHRHASPGPDRGGRDDFFRRRPAPANS